MKRLILPFVLCLGTVGCDAAADGNDKGKNAEAVYEIVFRAELKEAKDGAAHFLSVDNKDIGPELLAKLKKTWPALQPWSKRPEPKGKDRVVHIGVHDLKWIDRNTAEVRGGFSNGIDGRISGYRIIQRNGAWVIESVKVVAQS
ncbi:MAG: hypothetical protein FJ303_27210 [Planctomycetes bacterium]|nr:hypothetical protein [Planctomycetota bacterium]